MNLHKLIGEAWDTPWLLKAMVLFFVASAAWDRIRKWRLGRLRELAENWPMTTGRVVSREIKERARKGDIYAFVATATYSYFRDGQQSGIFRREFDSEDDAGAWLDMLFEKEVPVHFDPAKPSRSTLIGRELPAVTAQTQVAGSLMQSIRDNSESSRWIRPLAVASLAGLAACAVAHVLGLLGSLSRNMQEFLLFAMQFYAIAIIIVAARIGFGSTQKFSVKRYQAELDAVTPETLRWTGRLIYVYGMGWFAVTMIQVVLNHDDGSVPLAFFTAFQAIFLFEAYRMTQMSRWRNELKMRNEYPENR